jgi:hypothetical protein
MREADEPSTEALSQSYTGCARPTGGSHARTISDSMQRYECAKRRPRQGGEVPKCAAKGIIEAGLLHLASLQ